MKSKINLALVALVTLSSLALANISIAKGGTLEGVVNVNEASVKELQMLPGIGKTRAEAIVAYRSTSPFKEPADLLKVKGIGKKILAQIETHVTTSGPTTAKLVKANKQFQAQK